VQEKKHILLQKEQRLKEIRDDHAIALGKYKQTIKDQLFSNQDELSRNVTESLIDVQSTLARHHHEAGRQEHDLHEISARIDSTIRSHDDFKIAMRQWRNDTTSELREQATRRIASLAAYSEKQFKSTREQCGKQLKEELTELEANHDNRISNAMEQNKHQFHQMRKRCNKTINDNLDSITRLRHEVSEMKDVDRCSKKVLHEMRNKNMNIIVPLENKKQSLRQLTYDLESCNNQKRELDAKKQQLKRAEEALKEIEWDHEVLYQQFEALQKDHLAQKKSFNDSIYSAQQQSNYQNLLLEQRIQKLAKTGNKNSAAIIGILQRANIGLETISNSKVPITDVVKEKNENVQILQEELKRLTAAYSQLISKYETTKLTIY
jgi:hypothetical protein